MTVKQHQAQREMVRASLGASYTWHKPKQGPPNGPIVRPAPPIMGTRAA